MKLSNYVPKAASKSQALKYYIAKKQHRKLPEVVYRKSHKDPEFSKLSIEEYEKKYL